MQYKREELITKAELYPKLQRMTRAAIRDHGMKAWDYLKREIDKLSPRVRGDQEKKRFKWLKEQAFECCLVRDNTWDNRSNEKATDDAWDVTFELMTEVMYKWEKITKENIRQKWHKIILHNSDDWDWAAEWHALCMEKQMFLNWDEFRDEKLLDEFFNS